MLSRLALNTALAIWFLAIVFICPVWAGTVNHNPASLPDTSIFILAPVVLAAVVSIHRHIKKPGTRRRFSDIFYFLIKRFLDIILSSLGLLILTPFFALIALLIRYDSPGPAIYKRKVIGSGGRIFNMYKFRTMVLNAEQILEHSEDLKKEYYVNAKLKSDPRITHIGRFFRKYSLDEIPQLINILTGEMSLVGPRPIAPDEIQLYGEQYSRYTSVKPGMTGLWQSSGRSDTSYSKRVELDMVYIDSRSILLDFQIMLSTIPAVLRRKGAF